MTPSARGGRPAGSRSRNERGRMASPPPATRSRPPSSTADNPPAPRALPRSPTPLRTHSRGGTVQARSFPTAAEALPAADELSAVAPRVPPPVPPHRHRLRHRLRHRHRRGTQDSQPDALHPSPYGPMPPNGEAASTTSPINPTVFGMGAAAGEAARGEADHHLPSPIPVVVPRPPSLPTPSRRRPAIRQPAGVDRSCCRGGPHRRRVGAGVTALTDTTAAPTGTSRSREQRRPVRPCSAAT